MNGRYVACACQFPFHSISTACRVVVDRASREHVACCFVSIRYAEKGVHQLKPSQQQSKDIDRDIQHLYVPIPIPIPLHTNEMSLSFVSSTVQTGTADGGYEETPIDSNRSSIQQQGGGDHSRHAGHRPLFEQLRQNREEEEAKAEELQRQLLRGTCALDEEDVAHLDALERQRQERERMLQLKMQDELAAFRAARAEQQQHQHQHVLVQEDDDDDNDDEGSQTESKRTNDRVEQGIEKRVIPITKSTVATFKPKIIVKKRKISSTHDEESGTSDKRNNSSKDSDSDMKEGTQSENAKNEQPPPDLGSLLTGYGSSDAESD